MISSQDNVSMALFCDFENVALGVRDANYEKFDIRLVLERLLLKGSIVIKKAYCDWERYKGFKSAMHEANFELIEIPHVRQSGKNSADIRLVVDALDLCYTKSHVDTFVIISGDSDFSPLVSKLRENAKHVIGVGVKQSTSDLLIANCDEFIFYDDLVRESARSQRASRDNASGGRRGDDDRRRKEGSEARKDDVEARRNQAIDIAVETFEALISERGDSGKIWASALKDAIKRRKPDFNESYYGFRAFGNLLEEAQARGLLEVGRDEKSGTYVYRAHAGELDDVPATIRDTSRVATASASGRQSRRQPGRESGHESDRASGRESGRESGQESGRETASEAGHDAGRESVRSRGRGRGRGRESVRESGRESDSAHESGRESESLGEPGHESARESGYESVRESDLESAHAVAASETMSEPAQAANAPEPANHDKPKRPARRRSRSSASHGADASVPQSAADTAAPTSPTDAPLPPPTSDTPASAPAIPMKEETREGVSRSTPASRGASTSPPASQARAESALGAEAEPASGVATKPKAARKTPSRTRRPRKTAAPATET